MSVELIGWHDEDFPDHRRRMRNAMLVSLAVHGSVFAAFAVSPPRAFVPMPDVIAIELVAAPPAPASASRPSSAPAPTQPQTAAPEPPPPEPPPPSPPVAKAPVQVLPEESPGRIRKVTPEPAKPKVVAKVQPKPKPEQELSLEDVMAAFDEELGVDETAALLRPRPDPSETEASSGAPEASEANQTGVVVSPELAAWHLATRRRIQNNWVTPPSFRNRGLATSLELRLSAAGDLIGTPQILRSSGDPFFDDNAVRALLKASPLPPPPLSGRQIFIFNAEGN